MRFNDDDTKRGIEGRYWTDGGVHCVFVEPTNCVYDWRTNTYAWPRRDGKHRIWQQDGAWLAEWIGENVPAGSVVRLHGLSRGGAVALIAADYLIEVNYDVYVDTWGAPKPGRIRHDIPGVDYRLRGDIVPSLPLLYGRPRGRRVRIGSWRPILAHMDYKPIKGPV